MRYLIVLLFSVAFFACTEKEYTASEIFAGEWRMVSVFEGNAAGGGCACWRTPTPTNVQTLSLDPSGNFTITYPMFSSVSGCSGKYKVFNQRTIALTSSCRATGERTVQHAYERKGDTLIIDFDTYEGARRFKYVRL